MGFDWNAVREGAFDALAKRALTSLPFRYVRDAMAAKYPEAFIQRVIGGPMGSGESEPRAPLDIKAYKLNSWVFTCVRAISSNMAQVPLRMYRAEMKGGERTLVPLPDHPAQLAINTPNPYATASELKYATAAYEELVGDHFWYLARWERSREVAQIVGLRPDRVNVVPAKKGEDTLISHYEYMLHGKAVDLDPEDVLHFKYFNPDDPLRGQSTLQAARSEIIEDTYAKRYSAAFFRNNAVPKGALVFDMELDPDADYKRIRENWNKEHQGPENWHKIAIFEKGGKWQNIGLSQKDMDFLQLRGMTKRDIGSVFGVPPAMTGMFDRESGATYNNVKEQKLFFWYENAIPKLGMLEEVLNRDSHKLVPGAKRGEIVFAFDLSNVWALRQEQLDKAETDVKMIGSGAMLINEWRRDNNKEDVDWGDTWWRPIGLTDAQNPAPAPGTDTPSRDKLAGGGNIVTTTEWALESSPQQSRVESIDILGGDSRRDELRLAEWKGFIVHSDYYEGLVKGMMMRFFQDQLALMLKNLRHVFRDLSAIDLQGVSQLMFESGDDGYLLKRKPIEDDIEVILFDQAQAEKVLDEVAMDTYTKMTKSGGQRAFRMAEVAGTFDIEDLIAQERMATARQRLAVEVNKTTWNKARSELAAGIKEGENFTSLSERLTNVIMRRVEDRSRIARTEVIGSMNGGLLDGFGQTGVVKGKDWLTAGDENVRHAHVVVGRQKPIALDKSWRLVDDKGVESRLMFPGDPKGKANQVIHCRCTMNPTLKEIAG